MKNNIIDYYNTYDEDGRFFRNNGHQIEWITSMIYFEKLFKKGAYILDGIFLHMSPLEIEQIAKVYNTEIVSHIGTDGIGYLLSNKINEANEEDFEKWI